MRCGVFAIPEVLDFWNPLWGRLAQLVEQLTLNQRVGGSSPPSPTIFSGIFFWHFFLAFFLELPFRCCETNSLV